jgi:hypothetical protein
MRRAVNIEVKDSPDPQRVNLKLRTSNRIERAGARELNRRAGAFDQRLPRAGDAGSLRA